MSLNPNVSTDKTKSLELPHEHNEQMKVQGNLQGHKVSVSTSSSTSSVYSEKRSIKSIFLGFFASIGAFFSTIGNIIKMTWNEWKTKPIKNPEVGSAEKRISDTASPIFAPGSPPSQSDPMASLTPPSTKEESEKIIVDDQLKGVNTTNAQSTIIPEDNRSPQMKEKVTNFLKAALERGKEWTVLDFGTLDITKEEMKQFLRACPELTSIKSQNLQIYQVLQELINDKVFNSDRTKELQDLYNNSLADFINFKETVSENDIPLVKEALLNNSDLCRKIKEINFPLASLNLTSDELNTILSNFQNLTKLNFRDFQLTNELISKLPQGLTHLVVDIKEIPNDLEGLSFQRFASMNVLELHDKVGYVQKLNQKDLPPDLKELNIRGSSLNQLDISQLPVHLQKLNVEVNLKGNGPCFIQSNPNSHPESLIVTIKAQGERPLNAEDIKALPPTVKSLNILEGSGITLGDLHSLPNDLKLLRLDSLNFNIINKDSKPFVQLPPDLKYIFLPTPDNVANLQEIDLSQIFPNRQNTLPIKPFIFIEIPSRNSPNYQAVLDWCNKNKVVPQTRDYLDNEVVV